MTIKQLADTDVGRYFVNTEHSSYLVDLDARTIRRQPDPDVASIHRHDWETLHLSRIWRCEVGYGAVLVSTPPNGGVDFMRTSTTVQSIEVAA